MIRKTIPLCAIAICLFSAAHSVQARTFSLADLLLGDPNERPISVSVSGTIEIDAEERLNDDALEIIAADAFELLVGLTFDLNDVPTTSSMRVDQTMGDMIFNTAGFSIEGDDLIIDTSGLAPGTGLWQVVVDDIPDDFGFPDGRRPDDELPDPDQFIIQALAGSVNLGVAAFDADGLIGSSITEITPDDRAVFARAIPEIAPVPLPAGAWLMLGGLGLLGALRWRM